MAERNVLTDQRSLAEVPVGGILPAVKAQGRTGAALRFRLGAICASAPRPQDGARTKGCESKSTRVPLTVVAIAALIPAVNSSAAGIYSGPTDTTHAIDAAIPSDSTRFVEWANAIRPVGPSTN